MEPLAGVAFVGVVVEVLRFFRVGAVLLLYSKAMVGGRGATLGAVGVDGTLKGQALVSVGLALNRLRANPAHVVGWAFAGDFWANVLLFRGSRLVPKNSIQRMKTIKSTELCQRIDAEMS
jgi:hypothetical protein